MFILHLSRLFHVFKHFDAGDLSELSSMPVDLHTFVQAVKFLFIRRPAGFISTGFTSYIIRELQTPRVVFVNGHAKSIGGPNSANEELIGRAELDDTQEINYPAVMREIIKTGYQGFVAQEFIPTWDDPVHALRHAAKMCDV